MTRDTRFILSTITFIAAASVGCMLPGQDLGEPAPEECNEDVLELVDEIERLREENASLRDSEDMSSPSPSCEDDMGTAPPDPTPIVIMGSSPGTGKLVQGYANPVTLSASAELPPEAAWVVRDVRGAMAGALDADMLTVVPQEQAVEIDVAIERGAESLAERTLVFEALEPPAPVFSVRKANGGPLNLRVGESRSGLRSLAIGASLDPLTAVLLSAEDGGEGVVEITGGSIVLARGPRLVDSLELSGDGTVNVNRFVQQARPDDRYVVIVNQYTRSLGPDSTLAIDLDEPWVLSLQLN